MYGPEAMKRNDRAREDRFFRQLRIIANEMNFPEFSGGGRYLVTHKTNEVLRRLGGRKDDYGNHFTARMLMLLESSPVTRPEVFSRVVDAILAEYSRDLPGHEERFHPLFLINDIRRFWTTLLINYENSRNHAGQRDQRVAHRVKNYKLRISRLTTCFATIAAIESIHPINRGVLTALLDLPPRGRLDVVHRNIPDSRGPLDEMSGLYDHFLQLTGLPTAEIEAIFNDEVKRRQERERARRYGDLMYDVITAVGRSSAPHRGYHLTRMLAI